MATSTRFKNVALKVGGYDYATAELNVTVGPREDGKNTVTLSVDYTEYGSNAGSVVLGPKKARKLRDALTVALSNQ